MKSRQSMLPMMVFSIVLFLQAGPVLAEESAEALLRAIDANQVFTTETFSARMTVTKNGRKLTKSFTGYGARAGQKFFMAFTNPEDRGVRYLKLGEELWIYLPDAQDTLKISGHMLRQGMMGSDISYEDMLRNDSLLEKYSASLDGMTNFNGIECRRLVLKARVNDVAYAKRVCYVELSSPVIRGLDLFAKSGRLMKRMVFSDFRIAGGRSTAFKSVVRDMTRSDSETTVEFVSMSFDGTLPGDAFSKSRLTR